MTNNTSIIAALLLAAAAACAGDSDADTEATGEATFADAETNPDGTPREAARPSQSFAIAIEIAGTGELSGLDPTCLDGAAGQFEGLLSGTAEIDDGVYVAAVAEGAASFETPAGCAIEDLEIAALSRVVIRAALVATTQTCQSYCDAKARQFAEGECSGSADEVACRAATEGDYSASCEVSCESDEHRIVAETELGAAARADLLASGIVGSSLGVIDADLTFDHIVDASGSVVSER